MSEHEQREQAKPERDFSHEYRGITHVGEAFAADNVASIIRKDFPEKLAVDIVSSQLDADRMDYLLRDSYCTGVGYGEYDSDWLLHSNAARARVSKGDPLKLCLDRRRGLYAAERLSSRGSTCTSRCTCTA